MIVFSYLLAAAGAIQTPTPTAVPERDRRPAPVVVMTPPASKRPNPIPQGNPGTWANTNDYPPKALMNQVEGTTGFSVTVGPDGRVSGCQIISSSGSPDLDQATCVNVTRRARFDPALDGSGKPIVGRYQNRVRWQIPSFASMGSAPLQLNSYPRSPQILNPFSLRIAPDDYPPAALAALQEGVTAFTLDIDAGGKVGSCAVTTGSGFPELDRQACVLARKWVFEPARNLDASPTAGRTSHNIRWVLPKGAVAAAPGVQRPMINPFEKTGAVTITLDFDKSGKLTDCALEHVGQLPIFGAPADMSDNFCKNGAQRGEIKPFSDASGNAQPRRVILKVSVDHADIPATSINSSTDE
jgi:TonB family protein